MDALEMSIASLLAANKFYKHLTKIKQYGFIKL